MKKYKQVLAAFVAMNLTVYVMPTGIVKISASVESQEDKNTTETALSAESENAAAGESENTVSVGMTENTEAATASEEGTSESAETEDDTDFFDTDVEITEDDTDNSEDTSDIDQSEISVSEEEDMFSDGTQSGTDSVADVQEKEVPTVQAAVTGKLHLEQLKHYDANTKTMTLFDATDLILLSNCDQSEVQNITVLFNNSGDWDVTAKANIKANTDISDHMNGTTVAAVNDEENLQEAVAETESTESVEIQNNGEETDTEIQNVTEAELEDTADEQNITESSSAASANEDSEGAGEALETSETFITQQEYSYQGIGDATNPFQGKISGTAPATLRVDHSFFGGLSSIATVGMYYNASLTITWCGDGSMPMMAEVYQFDTMSDGSTSHVLPVKVNGASSATMGSLLGTVQGVAGHTLNIGSGITYGTNINATSATGNTGLICNTLSSGTICIQDGYTYPNGSTENKVSITSAAGSAGGVVGVMENGTELDIETTLRFDNVTVTATATAGNAGGLAGKLSDNAVINIKQNLSFSNTVTIEGSANAGGLTGVMANEGAKANNGAKIITSAGAAVNFESTTVSSSAGAAGGLAGTMAFDTKLQTDGTAAITLTSMTIEGGTAAGGVSGKVDNVTSENLNGNVTVAEPSVGGSKSGAQAGGFIGNYTLNKEVVKNDQTLPDKVVINEPTVFVHGIQSPGGGNAGGYFGILNLQGAIQYTIGNSEENNKFEFQSTYKKKGGNAEGYGAIAGQLTTSAKESTLLIQNFKVTSNFTSGSDRPRYHGGLIGRTGDDTESKATYLEVKNVEVTISLPHAGEYFGGITAYLTKKSILKAEDVTVSTNGSDSSLWEGAGILGYAGQGSVLELSGITDLTDVKFQGRYQVAQIVRYNNCGLIYATGDGNGKGWTYKRSDFTSYSSAVNDIGNYGQIIRLNADNTSTTGLSSNLITITEEHQVKLGKTENWSDAISLSSADDFALLSIAMNSRGYFSADSSITNSNWINLYAKNITLTADIDLSGTGITGLSRDAGDETVYTGTFSGGTDKHTLTLGIGETFGHQKAQAAGEGAEGCGKVYAYGDFHKCQGLFAKVRSSASGGFNNLVLAGKIHVSNAGNAIEAGGIAAEADGVDTAYAITQGIIVQETILADAPNGSNSVSVGGFFGTATGNLTLDNKTQGSSTITIQNVAEAAETRVFAGGVIGRVDSVTFKLRCKSLTVGGGITSDAKEYAYVGGLVGIIKNANSTRDANHWMEIKNVTFDGFKIDAPNATKMCGGLFGSIWSHVGVYFMGENDNNDGTDTKLTVQSAEINAPKAENVGGLAYRSSGIWEIRSYGIDMQNLKIQAGKNVGLLVCRGEKGTEKIDGTNTELGALYLNTTKYWDDGTKFAYRIGFGVDINVTTSGAFDEFVAYTAASADSITKNGENGVVSIATKASGADNWVGVDAEECTTYINRTAYGQQHQTNGCSRYYYDLKRCIDKANKDSKKFDGYIDTSEELLLWSVYRYTWTNISYFFNKEGNKYNISDITKSTTIGGASEKITLDMKKYSYYPIDLDSSITVQNAIIKFHNEEIEGFENSKTNKSTAADSDASRTQHYTMHCGLFLNHLNDSDAKMTVNVSDVTFSGSVGKVNNNSGSGVLFAGNVRGNKKENATCEAEVTIDDICFENLKVTNCRADYAPLLINTIGNYTTLTVNGITNSYESKNAVASSLIGNVGSADGVQINLSFLNISLPDHAVGEGGIFTHATLLESFKHNGSSSVATYNFYQADDRENGSYKHRNVTYGKEISASSEYTNLQNWYYDEKLHGTDDGIIKDGTNKNSVDFSGYLPYVCAGYNETQLAHEIKVNQRVADIVKGCGTYGHPYNITTEGQMMIISEYLSTGMARKDWRVTITSNQNAFCTGQNDSTYDVTYQFNGSQWKQVRNIRTQNASVWEEVPDAEPLENEVILQYMLNAYYDIVGTKQNDGTYQMSLTNFGGFGSNDTWPFRGVLTSTNESGTKLVLEGATTGNGLIPYSYGSVVKNLTVSYEGTGKTLTYDGTKTSDYYQNACFGGVIGCVLGGDNIIDNVSITMVDSWLTVTGTKKHLIPVGGYVGSVCGGGVIFRGMGNGTSAKTGLTDTMLSGDAVSVDASAKKSMYVNPYVGRVLDGFAFNESGIVLDNTDKNYKINQLDTDNTGSISTTISTTGTTTTVKDAQGLLLLSAAVNSGAVSGGSSNAYSTQTNGGNKTAGTYEFQFGGKYGKVRKASYSHIGKTGTDGDENLAKSDDQSIPGTTNLPYLLSKYGNEDSFKICSASATINLQQGNYDMTAYGSGYQGIAARYVSNAIVNATVSDAKGIVPELASMDGSGSALILDTTVKEYADDDFHSASIGGVFNLLRPGKTTTISNLTLQGSNSTGTVSGGVALKYYTAEGEEIESPSDDWNTYKSNVGVGGFAGTTASISASESTSTANIKFDQVTVRNMHIKGSVDAGGLLGSSGKSAPTTKPVGYTASKNIACLLEPTMNNRTSVGVQITNSQYNNIVVEAANSAGGFVGYVDSQDKTSVISSLNITQQNYVVGRSSKIGKADNTTTYAGGTFGYIRTQIKINTDENTDEAVMQGVTSEAGECAGGFIGKIDNKGYQIRKAVVKGSDAEPNGIISVKSRTGYAGGLVGRANGRTDDSCEFQNCRADTIAINVSDLRGVESTSGGDGGIVGRIQGAEVTISDCEVQKTSITGGKSGGVVGNTAVTVKLQNCVVNGTEDQKYEITGEETAGGMIGLSTAPNKKIQMKQCEVSNMKMISNKWGCGGMLGDVDWAANLDTLYLFDCAVEDSEIQGTTNDTTAGGFTGDIRGNLTASNLLLNNTSIHCTQSNKVGMVIGLVDSKTGAISVAGLSIQNAEAYYENAGKKNSVTQLYGVINNDSSVANTIKNKSYIAFADYSGAALGAQSVGDGKTDKLLAIPEKTNDTDTAETPVKPYVVTSPKSTAYVSTKGTATTPAKQFYLYGDGASWKTNGSNFTVKAEEIYNDYNNTGSANAGLYKYADTGITTFEFSKMISTYNANQSTKANSDFPVLQITGNDATEISKYLDIVTNGGFSRANALNTSENAHVTARADVYSYDTTSRKFIRKPSETSSLRISRNSTGALSFNTSSEYDNTRDRFTLLMVTFTETDINGTVHKYNVMVPVVVRRMLELDFSATLSYGTNFQSSTYESLERHVLESFGSSITAYLKYTYNSEKETFTDYGWQSYINGGGDVTESLDKKIVFSQGTDVKLPAGTQLSLVDCTNGKVYYYRVPDNSSLTVAEANKIAMSEFRASDRTAYQAPSIGELMGAVAESSENGTFIKVDQNGKPEDIEVSDGRKYPKPTVKIKNQDGTYSYYRLAQGTETGGYNIKVADSSLKTGTKSAVSEEYYLVVTVPKGTNSGLLNGSIQTEVTDKIPHNINYRTKKKGNWTEDDHGGTASTYVISSGYTHSVKEENITDLAKKISASDSTMKVDVVDTIMFPNTQTYNSYDELYQRFVGGIQNTVNGKTLGQQFPSGSSGTAKFYVYTGSGTSRVYYQYTNGSWSVASGETSATEYAWVSNNGTMELPLSTDGTIENAISLQGVRDRVKGTAGSSTFYVELKMDVNIPTSGLNAIPESKIEDGKSLPTDFTKLTYSSQLSTEKQSITYSTNRALAPDTQTAYYRDAPVGAKLTYEADQISQLGINLLDLQYLDASQESSLIDTTAVYDLSAMKDLDKELQNSRGIRFTLSLMPKNTSGSLEEYQNALADAKDYLDVELKSKDSGTVEYTVGTNGEAGSWSWTVPKETYWKDDNVRTDSVFNGSILTQAIRLKVKIDNVEDKSHMYSNYKVFLQAEVLGSSATTVVSGTQQDDNIIYTLAKIKPEFLQ